MRSSVLRAVCAALLLSGAAASIGVKVLNQPVPADLVPLEQTQTPVPATPVLPRPALPGSPVRTFDPLYSQQWNLKQIGLEAAWALKPGASVTVAVLDTGYVNSAELGARAVNGYDFVSDAARSGDGDGRDADAGGVGPLAYHAESVANLIGAARDGRGVVGVNPLARIVHVRVAGQDGMIDPVDLSDGIRWAAGLSVPGTPLNRFPARLLNLSLYADFIPLTGCDARIQAAIDAVTLRGALVIAGAANDGADAAGYSPAGCNHVLTVGAVDRTGRRASYSNWGSAVALSAPGGTPQDGLPLFSGGVLTRRNGTSFATPEVTGVASLMLGLRPTLTPAALSDLLRRSAAPFPGGRCDALHVAYTCGTGTLDAGAALKLAQNWKP
ncbi:S8 family serine peptidase [Deinococcus sp. KNUC1210]|uniref:S8 family serine peptidase n=1 Tax=Deinococcus sp. KNUC1210 TaxID=2917691 RepID=UPI001EF0A202|nr:S8 family serine peptidase [Deinococcus sp. KNUC1210]ULH16332.1 S8 family serine peptidase [Deinococcus sp. KNUC1210]